MHPALSVIFFTTASGAGYGMLTVLALLPAYGFVPLDRTLGIAGLGVAFVLVSAGLLSSTFHLGHPERAWRALTQWRSSWLSREGVMAVLTYGPWAVLAYFWIVVGELGGIGGIAAGATAAMSLVTIYCTAMIYRSLTTVHQWANRWTTPVYLTLGLASGAVLVAAVLALTTGAPKGYIAFCVIAILIAWRIKRSYWQYIDTTRHPATVASATGLKGGEVRLLEGPHTEENYLQQEMGFMVARKHAVKLRNVVHVAAFALPMALLITAYFVDGNITVGTSVLAAISMLLGVVVERWLFFAEARHVVTLYYGAQEA